MIRQIHLDSGFEKQLKALSKAGGHVAQVAEHAQAVIDNLASRVKDGIRQTGRLTRHREARIRNCVKYDLVHAYRLIGFRQGQDLFLLFLGTHDECDRWIRNNRRLRNIIAREGTQVISARDGALDVDESPEGIPEFQDDYDERVLAGLTERDLREIFRGLARGGTSEKSDPDR